MADPEIVYAACVECKVPGPLVVLSRTDHCEDGIGGLVLSVRDEAGVEHLVLGHDVSATPPPAAPVEQAPAPPFWSTVVEQYREQADRWENHYRLHVLPHTTRVEMERDEARAEVVRLGKELEAERRLTAAYTEQADPTVVGRGFSRDFGGPRPEIVVLCGSTRFGEAFREANLKATAAGLIVLSIGCDLRSDHELWRDMEPVQLDRLKSELDTLHKRKIDLADWVYVLNVGGYIGESTRSEIDYAHSIGRPVRYLEPVGDPR